MPKRKYCGYSSFLFTGKRFPRLLFFSCGYAFTRSYQKQQILVAKKRWIGQDYLLPSFFFSASILSGLLVAFILLFCLDFGGLSGHLTRQSRGKNLVQSLFLIALVLSKKAETGGRKKEDGGLKSCNHDARFGLIQNR